MGDERARCFQRVLVIYNPQPPSVDASGVAPFCGIRGAGTRDSRFDAIQVRSVGNCDTFDKQVILIKKCGDPAGTFGSCDLPDAGSN